METRSTVCGDNAGADVADHDFSDPRGWKRCLRIAACVTCRTKVARWWIGARQRANFQTNDGVPLNRFEIGGLT